MIDSYAVHFEFPEIRQENPQNEGCFMLTD